MDRTVMQGGAAPAGMTRWELSVCVQHIIRQSLRPGLEALHVLPAPARRFVECRRIEQWSGKEGFDEFPAITFLFCNSDNLLKPFLKLIHDSYLLDATFRANMSICNAA
jgi:hypothetical protein